MTQVKNILVPIDFSTSSYQVFELGHCLAKHNGANLHLIHVIDPVYYEEQKPRISDTEFIHKIRFENAKEELRKFKFEVPHSEVEIIEGLIENDTIATTGLLFIKSGMNLKFTNFNSMTEKKSQK